MEKRNSQKFEFEENRVGTEVEENVNFREDYEYSIESAMFNSKMEELKIEEYNLNKSSSF